MFFHGAGQTSRCAIVSDLSLRCFGGGSSDLVALLAPAASGSSSNGFGNFGQIGFGNNLTYGDEVRLVVRGSSIRAGVVMRARCKGAAQLGEGICFLGK